MQIRSHALLQVTLNESPHLSAPLSICTNICGLEQIISEVFHVLESSKFYANTENELKVVIQIVILGHNCQNISLQTNSLSSVTILSILLALKILYSRNSLDPELFREVGTIANSNRSLAQQSKYRSVQSVDRSALRYWGKVCNGGTKGKGTKRKFPR